MLFHHGNQEGGCHRKGAEFQRFRQTCRFSPASTEESLCSGDQSGIVTATDFTHLGESPNKKKKGWSSSSCVSVLCVVGSKTERLVESWASEVRDGGGGLVN